MEKERSILSQNITTLRKAKKLTQIELAAALNYSDKSVSKWENGDTIPDIDTIIALSEYFNVSMDALCRTLITTPTAKKRTKSFTSNKIIITLLSVLLVWSIAVFLFVQVKLIQNVYYWMAFIWACPLSFIVLTIFCSIWGNKRHILIAISFLTWTLLAALHINFLSLGYYNFWLIYILGIPVQISIILSAKLSFHRSH